jgi:hypothetical protein
MFIDLIVIRKSGTGISEMNNYPVVFGGGFRPGVSVEKTPGNRRKKNSPVRHT